MVNLSNFTQNLVKHKVKLDTYCCSENCLTQILELTFITIELDVETKIIFVTSKPNVSMLESIPLHLIATLAVTKQKPKKVDIVKKN
jgi:hypothetical protein